MREEKWRLQASDAENQAPFSDDKESGAPLGADAQQSAAQQIVEDPESEFAGESKYEAGMPRIINVGIKGPGERCRFDLKSSKCLAGCLQLDGWAPSRAQSAAS